MAHEVWPYYRPDPSSTRFETWNYAGSAEALPEYLEGWDPQTDIEIERLVYCDISRLRREAMLDDDVSFNLAVSWINHQSHMAEPLFRAPLRERQQVRVVMPAARLGGSITLRTTVTIASTDVSRPLGRARWAGSVLASDEQRVVLEGNGPMLPLAAVDFAATPYPPTASWVVQLPDDLALPVLGAFQVIVNSRDRELVASLSTGRPDTRQTALVQHLEEEIGAHLVLQATQRVADVRGREWDDESVGALLSRFLDIAEANRVPSVAATGDATMLAAACTSSARMAGYGRRLL